MTRLRAAPVLAAIIGASTALAATWALVVPLLQDPDENVHLDYVLALQAAGHPLTARDGRQEPDPSIPVSPLLALLEQATQFEDVRQHPGQPMPTGYASPAFQASLDARAANLPPPAELPFLVSYYPVTFYAIDAVVIAAALPAMGAFEAVIAARLVSVALLAITLLTNYLLLRKLRVDPPRALLVTAVLGLLPLTSFAGSYVQPDNLALLAVTSTLYLAVRVERERPAGWLLAALGASLALLAVTKYQDFAIVFAAVAAAFAATRRWTRRTAFAMLAGPAATLTAQAWISLGPSPTYFAAAPDPSGRRPSVAALHAALAHGPPDTVLFLLQQTVRALIDYFVFGQVSISFWGRFGWLDTPLIIVNEPATIAIRVALALGSIVVVALVVARLWRLLAAGRRSRVLVFGNPVLTSYVGFLAFMVAAFAYTGGTLYPQGRYWLPFLPGLLYLTVVFAPRALRRPARRALAGRLIAGGLVGYVLVAAPFALLSVEHRYYRTVASDPLTGSVLAEGWRRSATALIASSQTTQTASSGTGPKRGVA